MCGVHHEIRPGPAQETVPRQNPSKVLLLAEKRRAAAYDTEMGDTGQADSGNLKTKTANALGLV